MANKQPQIVTIDGTEYDVEKLSNEAKLLIDHGELIILGIYLSLYPNPLAVSHPVGVSRPWK